MPAHCLGSIWSQRDRRDRKFLAPTIRDTVAHTNTLANSVIATCLGALGMTAQDRARMVELWIHVAEVSNGRPMEALSGIMGIASCFSAVDIEVCGLNPCTGPRHSCQGHTDLDLRSWWWQAHFLPVLLPCVQLKILVPGSVTPQVPGVPSLGFLGICLQERRSP